jgi:hypothetical protein
MSVGQATTVLWSSIVAALRRHLSVLRVLCREITSEPQFEVCCPVDKPVSPSIDRNLEIKVVELNNFAVILHFFAYSRWQENDARIIDPQGCLLLLVQ